MTITRTGYEKDNQGSWIAKDTQAELIYSMDWSEWLLGTDTISTVVYALQVRANDPAPLIKVDSGILQGNKTWVQVRGGQAGKIYTVTAKVTTAGGAIDRRNFRIKVEERSA
jgi:hypothetical protein